MVSNGQPDARQLAYLAALDIAVMQRVGALSGADGSEPWEFLPWVEETVRVELAELVDPPVTTAALAVEVSPPRPDEQVPPAPAVLLPKLAVQVCELSPQWVVVISHMEQDLPASVWPFLTQLAYWLGRKEALMPGPVFRFPPPGLVGQRYEPHDYQDAMQGLLMRFYASEVSLLVLGSGIEPWLAKAWPAASVIVQPGLATLLSSPAAKADLFRTIASC